MDKHFQKLRNLYRDHQAWGPLAFFIGGFLFDLLTLERIDDWVSLFQLLVFLCLAGVCLFSEIIEARPEKSRIGSLFMTYRDEIFHFFLGSLLSAFTIFYFKSSSLNASFLFMLTLGLVLVLNELEVFRKLGLAVKFLLFGLCLSSLVSIFVPILLGTLGLFVFLLSSSLSTLIYFSLFKLVKKRVSHKLHFFRQFFLPMILLQVFLITLYFFKAIPPVPLSVKKIGIYHKVERNYPNYNLFYEKRWWQIFKRDDSFFKARPGDQIFLFAKVFSPIDFEETLYMRWQYRNFRGEWANSDRIPLKIVGGRELGYRGYAFKTNYKEGEWRVFIETADGLELARKNFEVKKVKESEERAFYREVDS